MPPWLITTAALKFALPARVATAPLTASLVAAGCALLFSLVVIAVRARSRSSS